MKKTKRIFAILMSMALALSMMMAMSATVFAADPAPSYDYPLTVTGLAEGDTVAFYQVVEWVGNAEGNVAGWKAISPYDTVLTKEVMEKMLVGKKAVPESTDPETGEVIPAQAAVAPTGMTSEIAGKLAAKASGSGTTGSISGGTATLNNASSGMWMALVTPKDANTIYTSQ